MKKLALLIPLLLPLALQGQAVRFSGSVYSINSSAPLPGALYPVLATTSASVAICAYTPGVLCSATATTFTDATATTACPSTAQLTPPASGACTAGVQQDGTFGGWLAAGTYQYVITTASGTLGPYPFTVGGSGGGGGIGTVTTFSSGNLAPIFTTSVATPTTTPAQTYTLSNAQSMGFWANIGATAAPPSYVTIGATSPLILTPNTGATPNTLTLSCPSCITGGIMWPTSGNVVVSNGTNSPAGLAPVNGFCLIGAGGAWTVNPCPGGSGGTPGGVSGNLQYNNAFAFGGDANTNDDGAGNLTAKSYTTNGSTAGEVTLSQGTTAAAPTTGQLGLTVPSSVTAYQLVYPPAQPTAGNLFQSCTAANPSVCSWVNPMVYPSAGIPTSTGSAWGGTTYTAQGTDSKLLSSGTVSGTGVSLCTDANGGATTSGCTTTGTAPLRDSYTLWVSGGTVYARNNATLNIDYSNSDAAVVINSALGALTTTGGTLYFRNGTYPLNSATQETVSPYTHYYCIGIPTTNAANNPEFIFATESGGTGPGGVTFAVSSAAESAAGSGNRLDAFWMRPSTYHTPGFYWGGTFIAENFTITFPANTRGHEHAIDMLEAGYASLTNITAQFVTTPTALGATDLIAFTGPATFAQGTFMQNTVAEPGWATGFSINSDHSILVNATAYENTTGFDYGSVENRNAAVISHSGQFIHPQCYDDVHCIHMGTDTTAGLQLDILGLDLEYTTTGTWTYVDGLSGSNNVGGFLTWNDILTTTAGTGTLTTPFASGFGTNYFSEQNGVLQQLKSPLSVANGGTGTATPGLVAGTNVTISGTWPNQTVNSTSTASTAFSALTGSTNTTAAMVVGSGASLAPTGTGTIQATNIASTIAAGTNVTISGSGTTASPYTIASSGSGGSGAVTNITGSVTVSGCTVSGGTCTVGTAGTSITFSSIPSSYNHLRIVATARSDSSTAAVGVNMTLNSDTGAHYDDQHIDSQNTTLSAGDNQASTSYGGAFINAATAPSGQAGTVDYSIYNYANTTFFKNIMSSTYRRDTSTNTFYSTHMGDWQSTSAITSVTLTSGGGNFIVGSTFAIYGWN